MPIRRPLPTSGNNSHRLPTNSHTNVTTQHHPNSTRNPPTISSSSHSQLAIPSRSVKPWATYLPPDLKHSQPWIPDLTPLQSDDPEEKMTSANVEMGYKTPDVIANEYGSLKNSIQPQLVKNELDRLLVILFWTKSQTVLDENMHMRPKSSLPTLVAIKDQEERRKWIQKLSQPLFKLQDLTTIPHFKMDYLIRHLAEYDVPFPRALWLTKVYFYHTMRSLSSTERTNRNDEWTRIIMKELLHIAREFYFHPKENTSVHPTHIQFHNPLHQAKTTHAADPIQLLNNEKDKSTRSIAYLVNLMQWSYYDGMISLNTFVENCLEQVRAIMAQLGGEPCRQMSSVEYFCFLFSLLIPYLHDLALCPLYIDEIIDTLIKTLYQLPSLKILLSKFDPRKIHLNSGQLEQHQAKLYSLFLLLIKGFTSYVPEYMSKIQKKIDAVLFPDSNRLTTVVALGHLPRHFEPRDVHEKYLLVLEEYYHEQLAILSDQEARKRYLSWPVQPTSRWMQMLDELDRWPIYLNIQASMQRLFLGVECHLDNSPQVESSRMKGLSILSTISLLVEWALTPHRSSSYRRYLVASIIQQYIKWNISRGKGIKRQLKEMIQEALILALEQLANHLSSQFAIPISDLSTEDADLIQSTCRLYGEFIRLGIFSLSRYLGKLIARGILDETRTDVKANWHRTCLMNIPVQWTKSGMEPNPSNEQLMWRCTCSRLPKFSKIWTKEENEMQIDKMRIDETIVEFRNQNSRIYPLRTIWSQLLNKFSIYRQYKLSAHIVACVFSTIVDLSQTSNGQDLMDNQVNLASLLISNTLFSLELVQDYHQLITLILKLLQLGVELGQGGNNEGNNLIRIIIISHILPVIKEKKIMFCVQERKLHELFRLLTQLLKIIKSHKQIIHISAKTETNTTMEVNEKNNPHIDTQVKEERLCSQIESLCLDLTSTFPSLQHCDFIPAKPLDKHSFITESLNFSIPSSPSSKLSPFKLSSSPNHILNQWRHLAFDREQIGAIALILASDWLSSCQLFAQLLSIHMVQFVFQLENDQSVIAACHALTLLIAELGSLVRKRMVNFHDWMLTAIYDVTVSFSQLNSNSNLSIFNTDPYSMHSILLTWIWLLMTQELISPLQLLKTIIKLSKHASKIQIDKQDQGHRLIHFLMDLLRLLTLDLTIVDVLNERVLPLVFQNDVHSQLAIGGLTIQWQKNRNQLIVTLSKAKMRELLHILSQYLKFIHHSNSISIHPNSTLGQNHSIISFHQSFLVECLSNLEPSVLLGLFRELGELKWAIEVSALFYQLLSDDWKIVLSSLKQLELDQSEQLGIKILNKEMAQLEMSSLMVWRVRKQWLPIQLLIDFLNSSRSGVVPSLETDHNDSHLNHSLILNTNKGTRDVENTPNAISPISNAILISLGRQMTWMDQANIRDGPTPIDAGISILVNLDEQVQYYLQKEMWLRLQDCQTRKLSILSCFSINEDSHSDSTLPQIGKDSSFYVHRPSTISNEQLEYHLAYLVLKITSICLFTSPNGVQNRTEYFNLIARHLSTNFALLKDMNHWRSTRLYLWIQVLILFWICKADQQEKKFPNRSTTGETNQVDTNKSNLSKSSQITHQNQLDHSMWKINMYSSSERNEAYCKDTLISPQVEHYSRSNDSFSTTQLDPSAFNSISNALTYPKQNPLLNPLLKPIQTTPHRCSISQGMYENMTMILVKLLAEPITQASLADGKDLWSLILHALELTFNDQDSHCRRTLLNLYTSLVIPADFRSRLEQALPKISRREEPLYRCNSIRSLLPTLVMPGNPNDSSWILIEYSDVAISLLEKMGAQSVVRKQLTYAASAFQDETKTKKRNREDADDIQNAILSGRRMKL